MVVNAPIQYHRAVPRELSANWEFRRRMRREGYESKKKAAILRVMCRADPLFFINTFCMTVNPQRFADKPERPFITYAFQEQAVRRMCGSIGNYDLVFLKSRATGASWLMLYMMLYRWLFFRSQSFLLVSRTEALVDSPKDMNALMPKLDFTLKYLPRWLKPLLGPNDRQNLSLYNPMMNSLINGASTTGNIGRGGRPTTIGIDEFAFFDRTDGFLALKAALGATSTCWFVSTPNGKGNAFHEVVAKGEIEQIEFKWEDVPHKGAGLYRSSVDGVLEVLDKEFPFPADYPYILDGDLRSPWYDAEERRTPLKSMMAQEHNRDFVGSGSPFFDSIVEIDKLKAHTKVPELVGEIDEKGRFRRSSTGVLKLWCRLNVQDESPMDRCYSLGVDISSGTGATCSCLSVLDGRTGEKVAEYAHPRKPVHLFVLEAMRLGRFFCDWTGTPALMVWERNGGAGESFGQALVHAGYENMFYDSGKKKPTAGFWTSPQSKKALLLEYANSLVRGSFVNFSAPALEECRSFEYQLNGTVAHRGAVSPEDASGARENHGDLTIADALANHGMLAIGEKTPGEGFDGTVEPNHACMYNDIREIRLQTKRAREKVEGWLTTV